MIARKGSVLLFGRGDNRINFVSVADVAALIERATRSPALRGVTLDIGGPEDLTFRQLGQAVLAARGVAGPIRHVPLPALRLMATPLRPVKPAVARLNKASVVMDTTDMTLAVDTARAEVAGLPVTGSPNCCVPPVHRPLVHSRGTASTQEPDSADRQRRHHDRCHDRTGSGRCSDRCSRWRAAARPD